MPKWLKSEIININKNIKLIAYFVYSTDPKQQRRRLWKYVPNAKHWSKFYKTTLHNFNVTIYFVYLKYAHKR